MNTQSTIHLKTTPALKQRAEKLADSLGLSLSALINLSLQQVVQASELTISLHPQPNAKATELLLKLRAEAEASKNTSPVFSDLKTALKWLHTQNKE